MTEPDRPCPCGYHRCDLDRCRTYRREDLVWLFRRWGWWPRPEPEPDEDD